jgi:hypothetical protein
MLSSPPEGGEGDLFSCAGVNRHLQTVHERFETLPDNCGDKIEFRTRILHLASLYIDLFHTQDMTQTLCYIRHYLKLYELEDALPLAERLRRTIKSQEVIYDENLIRVTISLGLAPFLHTHHLSPEDFYKIADRALYTSKNNGRDSCSIGDNGNHAVVMADN